MPLIRLSDLPDVDRPDVGLMHLKLQHFAAEPTAVPLLAALV